MEHLEHRVIKLELRVDNHEADLSKLQDISNALKESLSGIEKTLAQIKWLAVGGAITLIANEVGIIKVIKGFL